MPTISSLKEQAVTDTPLILFDCVLSNGSAEHWCTHAVTVNSVSYAARVLQHSSFDIQTASDQGVDGSPKISVTLANADSHFSEIERATGWKGAQMTVSFLFYDLRNNVPLTDAAVVFQGICNPPDQIKEATLRLTASNRMNLQRLVLPEVRVQKRCPWQFPSTPAQQAEAVSGGADGEYSLYYRCGYSAGQTGGIGNLNGSVPFTSCGYTRTDCQARGMFTRFGGLEYLPPVISVRGYGKSWTSSDLSVNQGQYNDFVPMVYGTAWYEPMVAFARNDGNLTRMEVLLGIGQMQGVITVLVNDIQIPLGVSGQNMTATGWYNVVTLGSRDGVFDMNFTDASGTPAGDPYGSMAYLAVVVPNAINNGNSLPSVKVLAQGLIVPTYNADGTAAASQFSSNPSWILLDVLRRSGWAASEIDIPSFAATAAYCDQQINSTDLNGNAITIPRFQCNLVLQKKRSAGDLVRGIRNAARLYLTYGAGGILQAAVENTIALQQPSQSAWTNSTAQLNGGWPAYEFGDGSNGFSGILRQANGEPSVTLSARPIADTPNNFTVEFQDSLNGYQQDSFSVVNPGDVTLAGQEVTGSLLAIGVPNYDQAGRILQFNLDKAVQGNTYIEFDTSIMAFGVRPGDIVTVTYLKEGFTRQPFRVLKISPATNYRTSSILAQIHDDAWYADGQRDREQRECAVWGSGIGFHGERWLHPDGGVAELCRPRGFAGQRAGRAAVEFCAVAGRRRESFGGRDPLLCGERRQQRGGRGRDFVHRARDGFGRRQQRDADRVEFRGGNRDLQRLPRRDPGQLVPHCDGPDNRGAIYGRRSHAAADGAARCQLRPCQLFLAHGAVAGNGDGHSFRHDHWQRHSAHGCQCLPRHDGAHHARSRRGTGKRDSQQHRHHPHRIARLGIRAGRHQLLRGRRIGMAFRRHGKQQPGAVPDSKLRG
jgi:hypothetical protein